MSFKILYVTATSAEANALERTGGLLAIPGGYQSGTIKITVLVAGAGSISTAWAIQRWISVNEKPDLAINSGIAGSFKDDLAIGDVVMPISDCFADAGIEDGINFLTLAEAGLASANEFPFSNGLILADAKYTMLVKSILKPVSAITVNTVTGSETTRDKFLKKYNPDIETMEGATFFYICSRERIPFLALRAISNRVGLRNKSNWDIALALDNLSEKLNEVFLTLK
jgi:futalosine hydrolase